MLGRPRRNIVAPRQANMFAWSQQNSVQTMMSPRPKGDYWQAPSLDTLIELPCALQALL